VSAPETATSYSVSTGAHSPRVKRQMCEVAADLLTSAKVKNAWRHNFTVPYTFVARRGTAFPLFLQAAEICREISLSAWEWRRLFHSLTWWLIWA